LHAQMLIMFLFMKDVAVKILSIQDFHDDQFREFLREVCKQAVFSLFITNFTWNLSEISQSCDFD